MPRTKIFIVTMLLLACAVATGMWQRAADGRPAARKESKMIVEYVRYQVPGPRHQEFLEAYRAAAGDLAASPNCLGYEIAQGVEEPDNFTVRIEWDSIEGHERGFRKGPQFPPFFAKVKPFFENIREMKHYQVATRGTGAGAGAR
jgi:quinol monooxygenase YgiN